GSAGFSAWVAGEMVNLTDRTERFDDPLIYNQAGSTVNLFAAANETVSFQLVIDAGGTNLDGIRLAFSDATASRDRAIPAGNIRAFRMLPVKVDRFPPWYLRLVETPPQAANYYDALVPIDAPSGGQPFTLAAKRRLAIWVDLYVPRDVLPGDYTATLTIRTQAQGKRKLKLALQVYDFVLPEARPIAAVGGFDHATLLSTFIQRDGKPFVPVYLDRKHELVRRGLVLIRQLMQTAHDHRLDLFDKRIRPALKRDAFGKVQLDWDDYDAIVMPYLSGTAFEDRVGCPAWPMPFSADWPDPQSYGSQRSNRYKETAKAAIKASREHFRQLGTIDRMFLWPRRGEVEAAAYEKHLQLGKLIRSADSDTPILTRLPLSPPEPAGWKVPQGFSRLADILAPPAHWLDLRLAEKRTASDSVLAGVWLTPGMPPYAPSLGVIATPADARALPWFAMKYNCAALFLPEVLNWSGDPFTTPAGAETRLFYP
ncbi:MAG: hypothetical protein KAU28_00835, partial [Phycisphaerae bacterium]|nr:hypothetical protein [Phycisphaerae bacterium]